MTPHEEWAIWYNAMRITRPALAESMTVPVVIVGGGLMGLTAAYELARHGVRAVLLERRWLGAGETGHTTAHVTARPDQPLRDLERHFGLEGLSCLWQGMDSALRFLETRSEQLNVPFTRVSAWQLGRRADLEPELELMLQIGASPELATPPAPLPGRLGLHLRGQARFNVALYLRALAEYVEKLGVRIFEGSAVVGADEAGLVVATPDGERRLKAERIILATHVPLFANPILLDRLRADQSYALAVAVPVGTAPDVLAEDLEHPYHYYRLERGAPLGHAAEDIVIFGGGDHETGKAPKETPFTAVAARLERWLPGVKTRPLRQWSGEIWTSSDGLPLVGEDAEGRFFATAFAGVGMTQATMAGRMAADWVSGQRADWAELLSASRFSASELPGVVERGAGFVAKLAASVLPRKLDSADDLAANEGGIVRVHGKARAAYRDLSGALHLFDARCTHAGCEVKWNAADSTWDCPCHGSRFTALGEVRSGPAIKPLEAVMEA